MIHNRGVINGKAGKTAALPKFSDMLTLSQSGGADCTQPLALPHLKIFVITPLRKKVHSAYVVDDLQYQGKINAFLYKKRQQRTPKIFQLTSNRS